MAANAEKIQQETNARGPGEQPRGSKPVRRVRWFIIVGILLAILVGGLVRSADDVMQAVANGAFAVSTSQRELWNLD